MRGVFLDLETTGLDPTQHRTIELAFRVIDLVSLEPLSSFDSVIKQPEEVWEKRDHESIQVNGFSWDEVCSGMPESEAALQILELFSAHEIERGKAVFICQNPSFDRAFFAHFVDTYLQEYHRWPYHWLDFASMHWALAVQNSLISNGVCPDKIPLSKDAIAEAAGLPKEEKPHRAMNGVDHLLLCYRNIVARQREGEPGKFSQK